jgi:RNA polymerase sigma-70 factor (ECF subfamily)
MSENNLDYETFMRLLLEEESAVKVYVRRFVPSWHDVEEVVQQTSLIAWKKFAELEDPDHFGGWLMTIARFEAMKYRRSLARSPLVFSDKHSEKLADATGHISAHDADRRDALEGCLRKLDSTNRELIIGVHQPGITIREYAQQKSRPEERVYKTIQRLRQKLLNCVRQTLAAEGVS